MSEAFFISLYFNKTLLSKGSEQSGLISGPGLILLLWRPRIPASFVVQQQLFTTTSLLSLLLFCPDAVMSKNCTLHCTGGVSVCKAAGTPIA